MLFTEGKKYSERIIKGENVGFSLKFVDEKSLLLINAILVKILSTQGNIFLLETLITIIREIIFNAFKANLKRLYFKKLGVDLNNTEQYAVIMENFKDDYLYRLDEIEDEITSQDNYHIQVNFKQFENFLKITVFNNVAIIEEEYNRITKRLEQSKQYQNLAEAYNDIYDSTEGAGLGLALMVFLLKNSGIGVDNLAIEPDDKGVSVTIKIPKQLKEESIISSVKNKVLDDVETLPTFPENIIELQNLCSRKDSTIDAISSKISLDPSLTADVIKLSNSAGFVPGKRISTIKDAVKIIGLKNLNLILTASAAKTILQNKYKKFEVIWEHCIRVAYYSTIIAKSKQLGPLADSAFIAGLLHDIGKIILMSADDKIINTISEITRNKQLRSSSILEEISVGISHAELGGLIADKWNFPPNLKLAIEHHHSPLNVDNEFRELTFSVYLANMLCGVEKNKYSYYYIETDILEWLNISSMDDLKEFHEKLKTGYSNQITTTG